MHMRVKRQLARMRVQHRHRARAALELPVVLAEGAQRLPGALHHPVIHRALAPPGQAAQFRRQGEGDQEIAARHQPAGLPLNPALALKVLAMRAIAVPAGVRHQALLVAGRAFGQHENPRAGAAPLHGGQGVALAGQNGVVVLRQAICLKAFDDRCQGDHLTPAQSMLKRFIKASMRTLIWSLVWRVRWV